MNVARSFVMFPFIGVLLQCANITGPGGEGNGSETTARGVVVDSAGVPAAGIAVQLLPAAYDPVAPGTLPKQWRTFTDSRGEYHLACIAAGTYALEAGPAPAGLKSLVKSIEITGKKGEAVVDTGRLEKTGTVFIQLSKLTPRTGDYVYLPGTSTFAVIDDRDILTGLAVLKDVPVGIFSDLIFVGKVDSRYTDLIGNTMRVLPGDTVASAYAAWNYARQLVFNTTASGAGVMGDVYDFPVLVRLNGEIFDFSQAQSAGEDVRFAKYDGSPLAHEVERWDPVAGRAEVWVLVDTMYGNNSMQSISMYWGASTPSTRSGTSATSESDGAAVFDTANGFQGVWHLGDAAEDPARDATVNQYHGISPDTARPHLAEGAVGNCRAFDGVADYISMPNTAGGTMNFPDDGYYTVSAWVFLDTIDNRENAIVTKGGTQYFLMVTYVPSDLPQWDFAEFGAADGWLSYTTPATGRQWTLLTGVCRGDVQLLYCNGVLADSVPNIYAAGSLSRNTSNDLTVGRFLELVSSATSSGSYCFFKGSIDEVRIESTAKSPDWVRLCYMNQRPDDRLVVFR